MAWLFEDEAMVAMDKPSGLLVHRGWGNDTDVAMTRARDALGAWVYPVHRLDRGTSGVLLFARSPEDARALGAAFTEGRVEKCYLALVRGRLAGPIVLDHPVPADEDGERVPAVTELRPLVQIGRYGWVEARPRTGRLHQIRRHLRHLACPIIGDVRYGKGEHNRLFRSEYGLHRLALHACCLAVPHPRTGARVVISAALPEDLRGPLEKLGVPPEVLDEVRRL